MHSPREIELNSRQIGFYSDENDNEANEPVTPGSGSVCEDTEEWTLDSTNWYSFIGTGGPVVLRVDGAWIFGAVLYQAEGPPTVEDGLACARLPSPRRFELDTEAGRRYLLQVGDWEQSSEEIVEASYFVNLMTPTPNGDRAHAIEMPFGTRVRLHNFGGAFDPNPPVCVTNERTFFGGRSIWARIDVPMTGSLHVDLEPEDGDLGTLSMVAVYPASGATPIACSVGPFDAPRDLSTEVGLQVPPGSYWVQFMTAVEIGENRYASAEERWEATANFTPNLDVDGDGHFRPSDCRDDNAAIHPGAIDLPDDGIDEDCDGQDARRDSDGDGVPDYKDRCSRRSSKGIDKNGDGCRDPAQLPLIAQFLLALNDGKLRVSSLVVRTDPGARVALECAGAVCRSESKLMRRRRAQFGGIFERSIPDGTEVSISVTKAGFVGVGKRYRLSTTGMHLLRQWCTKPGRRGQKTPCE